MGGAIGQRLLAKGHALSVFDPDPAAMARLTDLGATPTSSAAEAGAGASFIVTSLNSAGIVEQAVFGPEGGAERATPGTRIIDMSSIDPPSTVALARRAQDMGLGWVDAPLSGGAPKALTGDLTVMAGGTATDIDAVSPVMASLCARFTHMGPSGAGQTTKLINQILCGIGFMAVAEITKLAENAGVDPLKIPQALQGGRADSALLQEYLPRMAVRDATPTGRIDNMVKDLNGAQDLARATGTAMPLTAATAEIHRLLTAWGLGGADQAGLMAYFDRSETQE